MGWIILICWLVLLPICVGGLLDTKKNMLSLPYKWLWGQFLLWSIFQVAAVYYIVREEQFYSLVSSYTTVSLAAGALGIGCWLFHRKNVENTNRTTDGLWTKDNRLWFVLFISLWIVQMVMIAVFAVNDGDDAYYMAVASHSESAGTMYVSNVYSFGAMELNYRYALAPFPIWISFLANLSDVHTLTIGHIVLGMFMITMSYVIYASISQELFGLNTKKQIQLLIFIALIYIWGNTSSHTPESFLMLRGRQGKALASGLVFPAMIYLLIRIGHKLEQRKKIALQDYLLAMIIILTGCLGSTLGGSLVIMLWASGVLFLAVGYRRISILLAGAISTLPGMIFVVLYLLN